MERTEKYIKNLNKIFNEARDKHEANYQSTQIMTEMSGDAKFFTEILIKHINKKGSLNTLHYPVVGLDIELNENFGLVANCWIPLPNKSTEVSTKAIHHHGDMLLTTATAFGTGYEHWTFATPTVVDAKSEIYELKVLEQAPHPLHHVAFVDAYIAHLPLYPPDLTITYALWSNQFKTTWKDKLKRSSFVQKNRNFLKKMAVKSGLTEQLDVKVVSYFDFYPTCDGFRGIKNREEFPRHSNEDYLSSLFHIIQETQNEELTTLIREKLNSGEKIDNVNEVNKHLFDLERGIPIEGRLSSAHYGVKQANFTKEEIFQAIAAQKGESEISVTAYANL